MNKRNGRERELFESALRLPPEQRTTFLHEGCKDDPQLEKRVHRLLAAHEKAGEEQSRPASLPGTVEEDPKTIGPYRILERIGEGGMGVVYIAEQTEPVRRRVALKVIKAGMDTREVVARFHSERQALALMNHPNIARILDSGAEEHGRPYFVMEYVPGIPLMAYCDQTQMSVDKRLELFVDICLAVQHAHQKGVVHRDLKPSNVLVMEEDGRTVPKVIDFGIAKAIHRRLSDLTVHTKQGGFIGTPEYMSPEQAEMTALDVDTRTDVYTLGALLYELLVGARPFDFSDPGISFAQIQQTICKKDPLPPSRRLAAEQQDVQDWARRRGTDTATLGRRLRNDLDWVVMKALEKDRQRRYPSASELAADVRRHLANEPVAAGPPSASYRLGKFIRRHRLSVAAVGVLLLGLAVGIVGTTVGMVRARQAARTAEQVSEFLSDTLGSVNPERLGSGLRQDLEHRVEESVKRRGLSEDDTATLLDGFQAAMTGVNTVNAGLRLVDEEILARAGARIEKRFADQPALAARLEHSLGWTYQKLGLYDRSEPHLRRAVEIRRRELGGDHPDTLRSTNALGILYYYMGRYDEAEPLWLEALEGRRRVLGENHPDTLNMMTNMANLHKIRRHYEEAEALYRRVIEIRRRVVGDEDLNTLYPMNNLAILYADMERYDEAEALYLETLTLQKRAFGDEHPDTLNLMNNLANLYSKQGLYEKSDPMHLEVAGTTARVVGDEHPDTLRARHNLAGSYARQGRHGEAEALYLEILEIEKRVLGKEHPDTLDTMASVGDLYMSQRRYDEAMAIRSEELRLSRRALGAEHPQTLRSMNKLAWLLLTREPAEKRDPKTALELALGAAEGTGHQDPGYLDTLSLAYHLTGDTPRAIANQEKAIAQLPEGPSGIRTALEQSLASFREAMRGSKAERQ